MPMPYMPPGRRLNVLMADDSPADVELTLLALEDAKLRVTLQSVPDGVEAMAYLRKEGAYAAAATPDILLLDLEMPRMNGREVLRQIRNDPDLAQMPVVILTGSAALEDIHDAYDRHANAFVTKPTDLGQFADAIRSIEEFWLQRVTLPEPHWVGLGG